MKRSLILFLLPAALMAQQTRPPANLSSKESREHAEKLIADIPSTPIRFAPPPVRQTTLPSGATMLVTEEKSLPFLTVELHFKGGNSLEKVDHAGLWDAATSLLAVDGAGSRSGDEIAEEMSRLGARFSIRGDHESWVVSITALKWNFPKAFAIVSDILLKPKLSEERLAVILDGMETDIDQRNNRPESIAGRRLLEVMYPNSRRGYVLQKTDLKKITPQLIREDLNRRLYAPGVIVACAGDVSSVPVESMVNGLLAQFPAKSAPEQIQKPAGAPLLAGKILLVTAEVPQASVAMGTILPGHSSEDFYALQVANHILGGNSFNSRLMKEVRTARGLAYYSMSRTTFFKDDGRLTAASGTRSEQANETVKLMLEIIGGMRQPADAVELNLARESILNSLVFLYDDPESFLQSQVRFRLHGMPDDYLARYADHIRALTAEDVSRAYARHVHSDMTIVVVGPKSLAPELQKIRPVVMVTPEGKLP
ncbi:MAG TPA: pitrilysin family protein [Leptospiraceae bacterium]|nr:pitrilysin family protein [Leptospiraceae bacterium]